MKTHEIDKIIAQTLGWTNISEYTNTFGTFLSGIDPEVEGVRLNVPNFKSDHNAITKAIAILPSRLHASYLNKLRQVVLKAKKETGAEDFDILFQMQIASAEMKTEAYLRTIGKWKK